VKEAIFMRIYHSLAPRGRRVPALLAATGWVVLLLACTPLTASADDFNIVPQLGVRAEYDDNLFYTHDKTGDYRAVFTPGIEWHDRTERLDSTLLANINGIKYAHKTQLDTVDYGFSGNLGYQCTPRLNLTA
jgi:hypothetical protein